MGAGPRRGPALGRSAGSLLGVPAGAHSGGRAMEALAELLAALPALATALALLLAWLLLRRRPAASSDPDRAAPEPAPPTAVRATSAPPGPAATEDAAAPQEPGEPAEPAEEQAAEEKQVRPGPERLSPSGPFPSRRRCPCARAEPGTAPPASDGRPRRTEPAAGRKGGRRANSHPPGKCLPGTSPSELRCCRAAFLFSRPRPRSPRGRAPPRLRSRDARPPPPARGSQIHVQVVYFKEHERGLANEEKERDGAFLSGRCIPEAGW